jgi:hypothetical protein
MGDIQKKYGDINKFSRETETPTAATKPQVQSQPSTPTTSVAAPSPQKDVFAGFLKNMLLGQLNPIPGI